MCLLLLLLLLLLPLPAAADTFDGYVVVDSAREIKAALENDRNTRVYIKEGVHLVDNPIVISRTTDLDVYGAGLDTWLKSKNENQPLLRIDACSRVRLARLEMAVKSETWVNAEAVAQRSTSDCDLEMSQVILGGALIDIAGPGSVLLEAVRSGPGANEDTAILVRHEGARVNILGGDISYGGESSGTGRQWHVHVVRGWLGIWGMSMEGAPGTADIRIESSPPDEPPHYIMGVRSEGTVVPGMPATLLEVAGNARVVLAGNTMRGAAAGLDHGVVNVVGGSPTIWALANVCDSPDSCKHLIRGTLGGTRLIAVGNMLWLDGDPLENPPIRGTLAASYRAHNLYTSSLSADKHLLDPADDVNGFPLPARVSAPHALVHPTMTASAAKAFGWKNVVADYGAEANGVDDDTTEIQTALDSGCINAVSKVNDYPRLYFPAGVYRITAPLTLDVLGRPCFGKYDNYSSSLMAGAGPSASILRTTEPGESLFEMQGGRLASIVDMGFDLVDGKADIPGTYFGIGMDYRIGSDSTQYGALLHRIDVSGGNAAVVWGQSSAPRGNGSENMCSHCMLRDAGIAFASGHANAINNILVDSTVKDSEYAVGLGYEFGARSSAAKGVIGFHVKQDGVSVATVPYSLPTAKPTVGFIDSYAYLLSDLSGDAPRLMPGTENGTTAGSIFLLHDSTLSVAPQAAGSAWWRSHRSPHGLLLLDSNVSGADVEFVASASAPTQQRWAAFLGGSFSRYADIVLGANSKKSKTGF